MANYNDLILIDGAIKPWTYEWDFLCQCMDGEGSYAITGLVLPTPSDARTTAVESFTWHHMAPMVGFNISRDGSTVIIKSIPEYHYSQDYPYAAGYSPKITFSYTNSDGEYIEIGSYETESDYNGKICSKTITGVEKAAIYATCAAPYCQLHGSQNFLGYIKLHTHIEKPKIPTIAATTGKTIKITNGKDGINCSTLDDKWYDTPHTFTDLKQGASYTFKCRENCPDCPENNIYESNTIIGKTWNISGGVVSAGVNSLVIKAMHIAGTRGDANVKSITYELYESKDTSSTLIDIKMEDNNKLVTFTNLKSDKKYYCYAYTTNLGNGDNNCWIEGTTKIETTVGENEGDASATTIRATMTWIADQSTSIICTIRCDGMTKQVNNSGDYVVFSHLVPGTSYALEWKIIIIHTYEYTYTVIENGEEVEKTEIRTETSERSGIRYIETKKAEFGPIAVSSKIIRYQSKSSVSTDIMEHRINPDAGWDIVEQNTDMIYNYLHHNTEYTIYARISGCYAFNSIGQPTTYNDSEISKPIRTHLLSLHGSIYEEHQHSLITMWQAKLSGAMVDRDPIDNTPFIFTFMDTFACKTHPYQYNDVVIGSDGETRGDYIPNKLIYSNNLRWYYCEYIVTASITDGHNVVAGTVTCHTSFPATWIHTGGQWHRYMPHIYTNGEFVPAPAFIYSNGSFKEPNSEY